MSNDYETNGRVTNGMIYQSIGQLQAGLEGMQRTVDGLVARLDHMAIRLTALEAHPVITQKQKLRLDKEEKDDDQEDEVKRDFRTLKRVTIYGLVGTFFTLGILEPIIAHFVPKIFG